ncbi:hypothetical protein [Humisphaera borealis]|uniref:Uncharacterized protein n=1 Tax=Humisphaera borealis TaxID=2807512 RepID=A0A7M2WW65_9BACT|nr:hypothetical protein [Humisphaera borealis]QOV89735.1 hypothetical protein IPV69_26720 [Humisphaera borealis]
MNVSRTFILIAFVAGALAGGAADALACSVPVFRFALNYWPGDPYQLRSQDARLSDDLHINLEQKPATSQTARLSLGDREIWSGELTPATLADLVDSPARRELRARILRGESIVWLLVESGDADKDAAAEAALTKRLKYLESIAVVPEMQPNDPANRLGPGPTLTVRYSILRLSRKDPKEQLTLAMLDRDGTDKTTPIAYPVFGRCRVLIALPQEKLTQDNIDEVCQYLTAACSCEVKDRRIGWDLLVQCDWDQELAKVEQRRRLGQDETGTAAATQPTGGSATAAPATKPVSQADLVPEVVVLQARPLPAAAVSAPASPSSWISPLVAVVGGIVILAGVAGLFAMRKRS